MTDLSPMWAVRVGPYLIGTYTTERQADSMAAAFNTAWPDRTYYVESCRARKVLSLS